MTTVLRGVEGVSAAVGRHFGFSEWLEVDQQRLDRFISATGDPACTYLVVSLSNYFLPQIVIVEDVSAGINYGTGSVELGGVIQPGQILRAGAELRSAQPVSGGVQTTMRITVEARGRTSPLCTIDALSRYLS